jgi:plastocyanin
MGASVAALAGCGGDGGDGATETTTEPAETETETGTATETATATDAAGTTTEAPTTATETATGTPTGDTGTETVTMENSSFVPMELSVDPGTTVEWENADSFGHDVKSDTFHDSATAWEFQSDTLGQGETTTYTFSEGGIYEYYCTIHGEETMCGVVLVGDVSFDETLPCEEESGGY